ncbi:MAG TPA: transposase [Candidatus Angelobacter sp.]|nr:transposase [Candidatus Angelobacter sp.]
MTITMEVGEIERFKTPGDFVSYCRAVDSKRTSNQKNKGRNNRKCGNKYPAWAFVEAANFAKRYDERCRRWFDRKAARTNTVIATKALACKLAKAAWHLMAEKADYDQKRIFPQECGRAAVGQRKGWLKTLATDWRRRLCLNLERSENRICRRFDRAVSHQRVGRQKWRATVL